MLKHDSQSIKQLLVAEKRAEEKINQARKRKHLKLKQAKEDAQVEIEKFRTEKGIEFKEKESKYLGSQEGNIMKIERETDKSLSEMTKYVRLSKDIIIGDLLDLVFTIECEVHENFREGYVF